MLFSLNPLTSLASTFQYCCFLLSLNLMLQCLRQRQYIVTQAHPRLVGYPNFKRLNGLKCDPGRLPGLADWATRLGWLPHLSCKCESEKEEFIMDRQVTLPSCKQALSVVINILCAVVYQRTQ